MLWFSEERDHVKKSLVFVCSDVFQVRVKAKRPVLLNFLRYWNACSIPLGLKKEYCKEASHSFTTTLIPGGWRTSAKYSSRGV